jgi:hypothetical protein
VYVSHVIENSFFCTDTWTERERERDREREIERERRDRKWGEGQETISPVLKVPRQCPLVLLA